MNGGALAGEAARRGRAIKALIVGLGSIGRRHLANLKALDADVRVAVWRQRPRPFDPDVAGLIEQVVYQEQDALAWRPEIAIIATPASCHLDSALTLARAGVDLLVEKPLSHTLDRVDELLEVCEQRSTILMTGYNLRFDASLQQVRRALVEGRVGRPLALRSEVGQFLPDWRPGTDYRDGVSAQRCLGGGALLELSHELDAARWLMGHVKTVRARVAHVSDLHLDVEDVAEVTLDFASGAIGNVHLDMVQRVPSRSCRVIGSDGSAVWDGIERAARLFTSAGSEWRELGPTRVDGNASYRAELLHFLDCVTRRQPPSVSGEDGLRALEIAVAARRSSDLGEAVPV